MRIRRRIALAVIVGMLGATWPASAALAAGPWYQGCPHFRDATATADLDGKFAARGQLDQYVAIDDTICGGTK